jgi:2-polyprenyl-3-methyl-5-hydroxy-6-metoxy-1,4-benzoquinol methylase
MFAVSEGWSPSRESLNLVERHASDLIERFPENASLYKWKDYLAGSKLRLAFDLDYAIRYLPKNCSVLEVGASPYFLTLPLLDLGFKVSTLDNGQATVIGAAMSADDTLIEQATEGKLNASLICDLDHHPIPCESNSFDAVIINEVIEHLRVNLIHSINELHRILKPGGVLLMSTPNHRSIVGLYYLLFKGKGAFAIEGGVYEQFSYLDLFGSMGHIREYTPTEMQQFFERLGFSVNGIIYRGRYSGRRLLYYFTKLRPEFKPFFSLVCAKPQSLSRIASSTTKSS